MHDLLRPLERRRIKFPSLDDGEMRTIVNDLQSFPGRFGIFNYERLGD